MPTTPVSEFLQESTPLNDAGRVDAPRSTGIPLSPRRSEIDVSRETEPTGEPTLKVIDLRAFDRQAQNSLAATVDRGVGTTQVVALADGPHVDRSHADGSLNDWSHNDRSHADFAALQAAPRDLTGVQQVRAMEPPAEFEGRVSPGPTVQTEHLAPPPLPAGSSVMTDQPNSATPVAEWTPAAVVVLPADELAGPQFAPPGAPLAAPMYNDEDRVQLVQSLPQVDDSTPLAAEVAEDARRRISLVGKPFPVPPRTRVLTVANQKGGVGKTTTTVNIAAAMAQAGLNVLVLDIDPQGNASTALGIDHHADVPSLYDVVIEDRPLREVVQACPDVPNLFCAPATIDLAGAEIELVSLVAREVRLKKALEAYLAWRRETGQPRIDYVFVDCPPSLSLLTVNAFVAAREVFIPIQCEYYALEGLSQLLKHVELIRGHLNPALHVSTILLTMYDGRTRLSSQVADEVREHFPEQVVKTSVPRSVRISEAPSHGQTVMTYDPASSGALSYLEAARELAEQVLSWPTTTDTEEQA